MYTDKAFISTTIYLFCLNILHNIFGIFVWSARESWFVFVPSKRRFIGEKSWEYEPPLRPKVIQAYIIMRGEFPNIQRGVFKPSE